MEDKARNLPDIFDVGYWSKEWIAELGARFSTNHIKSESKHD